MADEFGATVQGLPDLRAALLAVPSKLRKRALRNALAVGARLIRDSARQAAPKLIAPVRGRTRGTLRKSIVVRTSKLARRGGDVGVFVNVRPAKGAARGALTGLDPYYWRWIEFGWNPRSRALAGHAKAGRRQRHGLGSASGAGKVRSGWRFLSGSVSKLGQALHLFISAIGPAIDKVNRGQTP